MRTRFYIYITTCLVNGKKYVGQHVTRSETVKEMLKDRYLGSGTSLINAIKKYGSKQFTKRIIKIFDTQEEADLYEAEYIEKNNVLSNRDHWYNLSCGGQYTRGNYHGKQISKIMKEVWKRDSYRESKKKILSKEEQIRKLTGIRIHLINRLRMIKNIKLKEEKQAIADEHGYKTYAGYMASVRVKKLNEYQRTLEGREAMSKAKKGKKYRKRGDI